MGATAAVFCMPERGHLQRLLGLIAGLRRHGVEAVVFTDAAFQDLVERAGGRFVDLFARYPLDAADATSRPVPCRYVTFAAHYAAPLIEEIARLRPAAIAYDTFSVIAPLLGRRLGIPYVNVCVGHNMSPARAVASLERDPRVAPSEACRRAVDALRDHWGIRDASPFSYFTGLSPFLNLYCEPPEFLRAEDQAAFEPIAFFGSLPPPEVTSGRSAPEDRFLRDRRDGGPRVYASFGTVMWRYYAADALRTLGVLADVLAAFDEARGLISLGGHALPADVRAGLERPNVRVADYVDQWQVLQDATVFVTHHGLNSTHESIYHRVPMLSYPFSASQQGLAIRCQELGVAIPLANTPRAAIGEREVRAAFGQLADRARELQARLDRARDWELAVTKDRDRVIRRILALMSDHETGAGAGATGRPDLNG